ncbi:MAG: neuraminidase-like domain-containing protein, partial [Pyrinomonadaceae bacterium]
MADTQDITLKIRVLDAQGNFRGGTVDVEFRHRTLSDQSTQRGLDASREINIAGLRRAPTGDYKITVIPTDVFKPQSQFVNIPASSFEIMEVKIDRALTPEPKPDPFFIVKGIVSTAAGVAFTKGLVRAIHQSGSDPVLLGESRTDNQGNYLIKYLSAPVKGAINLIVQVFDEQGGVLATSDLISPAQPLQQVDLVLKGQEPNEKVLIVRGTVLDANGRLVAGATVRAFDRDLRSEEELGQTVTNAQGHYQINYSAAQFRRNEKGSADLRVAVFNQNGRELVSSEIHFNAEPEMTIDLKAGPDPTALSEYERYQADLKLVLQGVTLIEIAAENPVDQDKDLDFLTRDTGIERQHIAWLVGAAKLEHQTLLPPESLQAGGVPAEVFYGWFRKGLPTDWEELRLQTISRLRTALIEAIDQNIIPGKLREDAEKILARVPNSQIADLARLLARAALSADKIQTVLTITDGIEGVTDEALAQLVAQNTLAAQDAQSIGLGVSLHRLTGGDQSLVSKMLDTQFVSVGAGKLRQARDLASLEAEDWERVLETANLPVPDGTTRTEYARSLAIDAVSEFPHAAFVQRATRVPQGMPGQLNTIQPLLEKNANAMLVDFDALDLAGIGEKDRKRLQEAHGDLKRFANLHPGLDLHSVFAKGNRTGNAVKLANERVGWLRTVFDLNPAVNFLQLDYLPGSSDLKDLNFGTLPDAARGPVLQDLKAHQRIYVVTNNAIASREIMQAGFHSASAIALTPVSEFVSKAGLPPAEARAHHAAARDAGNEAALIWFSIYGVARDQATTPIRSIPSPNEFFKPLAGFQDLINSQPWCECAHCQSVLSPAAYFVDLMYYIEESILKGSFIGNENHPLHLRVRRPDLWTLELTCKNTNDYVPYLDVVNEVLEAYLKDTIPELKKQVPPANTEDLYEHLSKQAGSFKQPFTLPMERLEILLGHFGLSRYDVAKAMGSDKQRQARTRLKISKQECDLITTERTANGDLDFFMQLFKLKDAISISSADALFKPIEMQALLYATGLPHDTVASVLNTKFVLFDNATINTIQIVLGKRKPDDVQNNSEMVQSLTLKRLDRIHRFVRLWRKLPWSIEELDYVLGRLKTQGLANGIDGNALNQILDLLELNAKWSLPIDELMALSDVFPEKGLREPTSLFDRLFNQQPFIDRDGSWPPQLPRRDRFTHPAWANSPQGISSPDNNTLSRLLAGLQLGDKELLELIASLSGIPVLDHHPATLAPQSDESIKLSKDSLGLLYRHARLMRLLKCTMTDFIKLISLTPRIAARNSVKRCLLDLEDVASVIEFTASQRASGFSLDEMVYVTGGTRPEGSPEPAVLASEIVARVKADKSLEFADTVFTQIGFTDVQSRKIVTDNVGPGKAFSRLTDGASYRLNAGFILDSGPQLMKQGLEFADTVFTQIGLTHVQSRQVVIDNKGGTKAFEGLADGISFRVNAGFILDPAPRLLDSLITLPADERDKYNALAVDLLRKYGALAADLLRKYDAICALDVALGGALNLSPEQTKEVRQLTRPLRTDEVVDIQMALQGGDRTRLTALLTDTLRYRALFKSKVFLLKNKLSNDGLSFVGLNRGVFGLPKDPADPEYHKISTQAVWNVAAYVALAKATDAGFTTASGPADLDAIQRVTKDFGAASATDLAKALRTDEARIAALKPHLIAFPSNPFDALGVLTRCLGLMEQMGVSGETLSLMNNSADKFIALSRAAEDVFGAFRAKYPNAETFNEKMEPFEDKLRTRKRDGLVDFIVSAWPETFTDPNKLYEYFLIDVLQGGCARTSRVVAAISSLQLYVYRVLMHLEWSSDFDGRSKGVNARFADSGKRDEWYWRKHYRVWEANRKVFLYPENYIEPELRDDKTPLFKELEETLLQQEINDPNAHDAYAKYLTGFEEVAHLAIAGAYYDSGTYSDHRDDALHLFGVTQHAPPVYYYRVINNTTGNARVSAWQKLTLQIPVRKVSPIVFEGRLYIFWMETTTRALNKFDKGTSKFEGYRHSVRVKYSRQRPDGQWISPQVLGFVNGSAKEECRVVDDPPTDNADRLAELRRQIGILTPESERLSKKAADAEEPARVADNLAQTTARELRTQTDTVQPNVGEWLLIVGASAVLAPVVGPELALAQALIAWRALKLKPFVDAANAAAEDRRKKAEE